MNDRDDARAGVRALVESAAFNRAIIAVIIFNALLIGVDTYVDSPVLGGLQWGCVGVYVVELVLKFAARRGAREFFADGWNIFDLIIVVAAFVPEVGALSAVLRVLRVLRVFRLVRTIPELRLIVTVLARSIVSMKYIGLLALICFYIFAVAGYELFGRTMPEFGSLHESLFTLFRVLTGDDWSQLRYESQGTYGVLKTTLFYVAWIIVGTFILINLVVGAIINNYQEVQQVERNKAARLDASEERVRELVDELQRLLRQQAADRAAGR